MSNVPASFLPLTEPAYYILLSLASGRKHGYAIIKDVASLSQESLSLSVSTLYTALGRFQDQGLIERITDPAAGDQRPGLPRKVYKLTRLGRRVLEAETARLEKLVSAGRERLSPETT